jgi:hypothetical protein
MTPAEHDKRQAESDAGMEQWEERPDTLLKIADEILDAPPIFSENAAEDIQSAAAELSYLRNKVVRLLAEVERLWGENAALRRKAEAFDVIASGTIHDTMRVLRSWSDAKAAAKGGTP